MQIFANSKQCFHSFIEFFVIHQKNQEVKVLKVLIFLSIKTPGLYTFVNVLDYKAEVTLDPRLSLLTLHHLEEPAVVNIRFNCISTSDQQFVTLFHKSIELFGSPFPRDRPQRSFSLGQSNAKTTC